MDHKVFEHLVSLNRSVDAAIETLLGLAEYPELQTEDFTIRQAYFREYLAYVNMCVLDAMEVSEQRANGAAFKERRAYEKKTRDPDDCYLEVQRREEERTQQGLPSLIGIQPRRSDHIREETNDAENETEPEIYVVPEEGNDDLRQKIIVRVDDLRIAKQLTKQEFNTLVGPPAARSWNAFIAADSDERGITSRPRCLTESRGLGGRKFRTATVKIIQKRTLTSTRYRDRKFGNVCSFLAATLIR